MTSLASMERYMNKRNKITINSRECELASFAIEQKWPCDSHFCFGHLRGVGISGDLRPLRKGTPHHYTAWVASGPTSIGKDGTLGGVEMPAINLPSKLKLWCYFKNMPYAQAGTLKKKRSCLVPLRNANLYKPQIYPNSNYSHTQCSRRRDKLLHPMVPNRILVFCHLGEGRGRQNQKPSTRCYRKWRLYYFGFKKSDKDFIVIMQTMRRNCFWD